MIIEIIVLGLWLLFGLWLLSYIDRNTTFKFRGSLKRFLVVASGLLGWAVIISLGVLSFALYIIEEMVSLIKEPNDDE